MDLRSGCYWLLTVVKVNRALILVALSWLVLQTSALAFYNPEEGRWVNRDPIGEKGGGPSLYGFCMNSAVNRQDLMGLLTFLVQDCQGCNAGGFLESWGYWYDGFETDPGCQSKWETSEDLAFGWFSHRCGSWPFYPNICNTETYIRIKALNTTCCRKWKIACTYAYSGIVQAQDDANLTVEFYFLGERVDRIRSFEPKLGGVEPPPYLASGSKDGFVSRVISVPKGSSIDVFLVRTIIRADGRPNEIEEEASVNCVAWCTSE